MTKAPLIENGNGNGSKPVKEKPAEKKVPLNLIYAHFFFCDVVGLSDPRRSVKHQIRKIEALNSLIASTEVFRNTDKSLRLLLPTGDGMAIGFLQGPELPLLLAIELHKKVKSYNRGKFPEEQLGIRIGMNDGPVFVVNDIDGNQNVWGPGIIMARRVMDFGEDEHILLSTRMAETLRELSDEYKVMIRPLHDYGIKHGQTMLLYSAYGKDFGNPKIPEKGLLQRSKAGRAVITLKKTTVYNDIDVELSIRNPKTMLTHHRRRYGVECVSEDPIHEVFHGIGTDVEKSFNDLNIKTFDESGRELRITSINFDKPYQKEFTTAFNTPVYKGEKDRNYTLEYDVEEPERYFENYFAVGCSKYSTTLIYPAKAKFEPEVYEVTMETGQVTKSKTQPIMRKFHDGLVKARWVRTNVKEGQTFRLKW